MEVNPLTAFVAVSSAFLAAVSLVPFITEGVKRSILSGRAQSSVIGHDGFVAAMVRNGVRWLKPVARRAMKEKHTDRFICDVERVLAYRGYMTTGESVGSLLGVIAILAFIVGCILGSSLIVGLVSVVATIAIIGTSVKQAHEARKEALRASIPEALRSMSICSHAGYSLRQTFEQVASEVAEPLRSLFRHAVHDLEAGRTVSEALGVFCEKSEVSELAFVSVALDVQHRAGGSLQQVLDAARDSVESELDLKRTLRVQTAQAKLSARIVSIMPFILIAVFSLLSPGFLDPFFKSLEGMALLGLAVSMQFSGIILVRRLLDVEID